jgi:hypothetical protein
MFTAMTLRAGVLALGLAVGLLSGCGGQQSSGPASTSSMQPATTKAAPNTSPSSPTGEQAPDTAEPEAITDLKGFTAPSGNVGCFIDSNNVRCDISERDWSPPPRPVDCEFDYGQGITLSPGEKPEFTCAGDTTLGGGEPLAYGQSISKGTLQCDSAESGITCRDTNAGHGFSIAREAYTLF